MMRRKKGNQPPRPALLARDGACRPELASSEGWWPGPESNQRHPHFQCGALPTELPGPQECSPKDVQKHEYNRVIRR